jgi:YVTN family beta-propeller protein
MRPTAVLLVLVLSSACASSTGAAGSARPTPSAAPVPTGVVAPVRGAPSSVVARIATGGQPCGVVGAQGSVWVTDAEKGVLLQIDPRRNTVVRRTPLDPSPCELVEAFGSLWVVTQSGVLDRVDPRSGRVLAKVPVGDASYEAIPVLGSVWVSNRNSGTVSVVDPRTNRVTRTIELPGLQPGGLAVVGAEVVVGNDTGGSSDLAAVDARTGAVRRLTAGRRPGFVAAVGGAVFVANRDDGTVSRIDAASGKAGSTAPAGISPVNLAALPGSSPEVWVPDDVGNLLTRLDGRTGEVIERLLAGGGPAVVTPVGTDVWVTNFEGGSVWRIRPGAR